MIRVDLFIDNILITLSSSIAINAASTKLEWILTTSIPLRRMERARIAVSMVLAGKLIVSTLMERIRTTRLRCFCCDGNVVVWFVVIWVEWIRTMP